MVNNGWIIFPLSISVYVDTQTILVQKINLVTDAYSPRGYEEFPGESCFSLKEYVKSDM